MKMNSALALKMAARSFPAAPDSGVILLSSATLDVSTGLYTYRYVVDNRTGSAAINEINILVDSKNENVLLTPTSHRGPTGWDFAVSLSGSSANPPLKEFGTFWGWFNDVGVPSGTISQVFSFVTARGQDTFLNHNYFLYSLALGGVPPTFGIASFGHVSAPDFGVISPPEFTGGLQSR